MATTKREKRKASKELSNTLKRDLNEAQLATLQGLETFGWELKFVRRKPFHAPVAVVFDGDRKKFAVLDEDGTLQENPGFDIRS